MIRKNKNKIKRIFTKDSQDKNLKEMEKEIKSKNGNSFRYY